MPTESAKATAMRARARRKLAEEKRSMNADDKARLPQIQKRLGKKVRSSFPTRQLTPATA